MNWSVFCFTKLSNKLVSTLDLMVVAITQWICTSKFELETNFALIQKFWPLKSIVVVVAKLKGPQFCSKCSKCNSKIKCSRLHSDIRYPLELRLYTLGKRIAQIWNGIFDCLWNLLMYYINRDSQKRAQSSTIKTTLGKLLVCGLLGWWKNECQSIKQPALNATAKLE